MLHEYVLFTVRGAVFSFSKLGTSLVPLSLLMLPLVVGVPSSYVVLHTQHVGYQLPNHHRALHHLLQTNICCWWRADGINSVGNTG